MPSLYARLLGDAFRELPPVLQRFHAAETEARAEGTLSIRRGKGVVRSLCAVLMRLPPVGEQVPICLQVLVSGEQERWTRDFGDHRLVTKQWSHDGLLMERAGPLCFGFRLSASAGEMCFAFVRCWAMGIPLPYVLAPRVNATARAYEKGWWIRVWIEMPLLGLITEYEGEVVPQG
jgi:hypothetical protein